MRVKLFFLVLFGVLFLGGCISVKPKVYDGGVFISTNKGIEWKQKVFLEKQKKKEITISRVSVLDMDFDTTDDKILYIGTKLAGGFKTDNNGDKWERFGPPQLQYLAINPKNNNQMYAISSYMIFKSIDAGKSWNLMYTEPRRVPLVGIEVDAYKPERIYVIANDGQLLKTKNSGISWAVLHHFKKPTKKLLLDPRDTRKLYVFTAKKGIYRSFNLGKDWVYIKSELDDKYSGALIFYDAVFDFSANDSLILASEYGLLQTGDGGKSWQALNLLTPPRSIRIYTVAVNPRDKKNLFYTTAGKLYRTDDGAETWTVIPIPTSRAANFLRFNNNASVLFMGTQIPPKTKKKGFF